MMRIKTDQDMNDDDDDDLHTSMTSETSMILKNDSDQRPEISNLVFLALPEIHVEPYDYL